MKRIKKRVAIAEIGFYFVCACSVCFVVFVHFLRELT